MHPALHPLTFIMKILSKYLCMYVLHVLTYMSNLLVFAQETKKGNTNTKIKSYNYVGTARNYL